MSGRPPLNDDACSGGGNASSAVAPSVTVTKEVDGDGDGDGGDDGEGAGVAALQHDVLAMIERALPLALAVQPPLVD